MVSVRTGEQMLKFDTSARCKKCKLPLTVNTLNKYFPQKDHFAYCLQSDSNPAFVDLQQLTS